MAIARSQFVGATGNAVSSLSAVFSSAVSSGSLIVVHGCYWHAGGITLSTISDNVNGAYTRRIYSTMSNASDTVVHLSCHDSLNISSGRGASTYRVQITLSASAQPGFCAVEYTGGPFVFGSTISANGTSSGPAAGALTASSTPTLFVSGSVHNSVGIAYRSTGLNGSTYVTTVDPTNANQVLNVVESVGNSSLQQNPGHVLDTSTRWLAASVVYTGLGAGAATDYFGGFGFPLMGVQ